MPSRVSHSSQSCAWILLCLQRHRDAIERQRFAVGIHPHRHRGAGAEARQHEIVRPGTAVLAAGGDGLVGQHPVRADRHGLLELAVAGLAAPRPGAALRRIGGRLRRRRARYSARPRRRSRRRHRRIRACAGSADDRRRPARRSSWDALRPRRSCVALSMPTVSSVGECMTSSALCSFATCAIRLCSAMSSRNSRLMWNGRPASWTSTLPCVRMSSMRSLKRCVTCAGSEGAAMVTTAFASGICPAAARIAAPPRLWPIRIAGALPRLAQMIGGADEIGDVGGKGRVGEIAFAGAEPGEVEPQHRDALGRQRGRDALGRQHVLAAGEAMRKQRVGADRPVRRVQRGGELMALRARELKAFGRHGVSCSSVLGAV